MVGGWDERELRKWLCCVIYGVMTYETCFSKLVI